MQTLWIRLVRFGFRLLYNELAWTYDAVSWAVSLGEWRHWLMAGLPFINGRSILEVGHGPGHLLLKLAQAGYHPVGVDLSPQMGRQAKRRLQRAGVSAQLVRASVAGLPFANGRFDTIFSTFPTDYIVEPEVIGELYRVLGDDGRLIIIPEGHLTTPTLSKRLIDWLYRITNQTDASVLDSKIERYDSHPAWRAFRDRYEDVGFTVQIKQAKRPKSSATIIVALKTG